MEPIVDTPWLSDAFALLAISGMAYVVVIDWFILGLLRFATNGRVKSLSTSGYEDLLIWIMIAPALLTLFLIAINHAWLPIGIIASLVIAASISRYFVKRHFDE